MKHYIYLNIVFLYWVMPFAWTQTSHENENCTFGTNFEMSDHNNTFMVLTPGWYQVLEGEEKGRAMRLEIEVLEETVLIGDVLTRVVREREWVDNALHEEARNYYAICMADKTIYQFGKDEAEYLADGSVKKTSWRAGELNAIKGVTMPGSLSIGQHFYTEWVPSVEEEQVEVHGFREMELSGKLRDVVVFTEISAYENDLPAESIYARGIGLVKDDDGLFLVSWGYTPQSQ